jgi:hypothetical protein
MADTLELLQARVAKLEAQANHSPGATKMVPPPVATDEELAPLLWVLWHHLGGGSAVGQPIRKYLGMGQFERMSDQHIKVAARWAQSYGQASSREVADPAPVEGEVEELVADLRTMATDAGLACQPGDFKILTRAANMIQKIGERVPAKGDEPAPVAGGLVTRVAQRLVAVFENGPYTIESDKWDKSAARAAILEVARWMRSHDINGSAKVLEQEAER